MDVAWNRDVEAYRLASEELRLQVDRTWQLTQFFILLNGSVAAGALALLQFASRSAAFLLLCIAAGGFGLSLAALQVTREAKRYYRRLVAKKTMLEKRLGLADPIPGFEQFDAATYSSGAVATQKKVATILADPDAYVEPRIRRGSLTGWAQWTLLGFSGFHVLLALVIGNALGGCWVPLLPCGPVP